jgi:hypothetical protein
VLQKQSHPLAAQAVVLAEVEILPNPLLDITMNLNLVLVVWYLCQTVWLHHRNYADGVPVPAALVELQQLVQITIADLDVAIVCLEKEEQKSKRIAVILAAAVLAVIIENKILLLHPARLRLLPMLYL